MDITHALLCGGGKTAGITRSFYLLYKDKALGQADGGVFLLFLETGSVYHVL